MAIVDLLSQACCLKFVIRGSIIQIFANSLESGNMVHILRFYGCVASGKSTSVSVFLSKTRITAVSTS